MNDPGDMIYIDHMPQQTPAGFKRRGMKVAVFDREKDFVGTGEYIGEEIYFCKEHGAGSYDCVHLDHEYGSKVVYGCCNPHIPLDKLPPHVMNEMKKQSSQPSKPEGPTPNTGTNRIKNV